MPKITKLRATCKINLGLAIGRCGEDGYHALRTLFYPLSYPADELLISPRNRAGFELHCPGINPAGNLLTKTFQIFCQTVPFPYGLKVAVKKRIPAGAGLGGGSSDAAHLLRWLNHMAPEPLTLPRLYQMASTLGADVPFFLGKVPCVARGKGDQLTPVSLTAAGYWILLLCPPIHSSTAMAYSALDEMRHKQKCLTTIIPECKETFSKDTALDVSRIDTANDLELPVFARFPQLSRYKDILCQSGAIKAAMSGSGSAVYGIFAEYAKACAAAAKFRLQGIRAFLQPMQNFGM